MTGTVQTSITVAPEDLLNELEARLTKVVLAMRRGKEVEPIYSREELKARFNIKDNRTFRKVCIQHKAEPITTILEEPYYFLSQFINQTWKK